MPSVHLVMERSSRVFFFLFYNFLLSSLLTFLLDVECYLFLFFFQVIDLIEYKAEDDDDCYELQNILMDPHVAVSHLKVQINSNVL